jgi:hypothetical protein
MSRSGTDLVELQEHCEMLSFTLSGLWRHDPVTYVKDGETLEFNDAAEWLNLASGVKKVEVVTGGEDVFYCESVMEYEDARSELLSRLATQLTIFQFTWGAFETAATVIGPPSIPANLRSNGANGLVHRVLFFLRAARPVATYPDVLEEMRRLVARQPNYRRLLRSGALPRHMGPSGVGLDFVRKVRNRFAHGSARFPMPDDCSVGWSGRTSPEPEIIALSSRIVLLSIQMLLRIHYGGKHFELDILRDEDGRRVGADVHHVLQRLHLSRKAPSDEG